MQVFVRKRKSGIMINANDECKELIDKSVCDKGFIWNPSNRECECDKSYDVGEYLDYGNCKCRKRLVDKLVEKCTENVEEVNLAKITPAEHGNMFLHNLCCLNCDNLYNQHWNWYLFCLLQIYKL